MKCSKLQEPNITGARQREKKIGHIPDAGTTLPWWGHLEEHDGRQVKATTVGALRGSRPWLPKSDQRELVAAPMAEAGWCSNAR